MDGRSSNVNDFRPRSNARSARGRRQDSRKDATVVAAMVRPGHGLLLMVRAMPLSTTDETQVAAMPLPLVLLLMDVLQARGRREAVERLVDELYARAEGEGASSR